ncbi:hypothetical protein [Glycomyces dulcitolivorans]|uniref:hypothetical protein n=1 Tax=Glycomyces dulcitolivorans TaxID=2200759 RepID=UPI000DD3CDB1|nr:hypothetical protein [Glycomyces dulcitolivorans]
MKVLAATENGVPGRPNEDHFAVGANSAIVIDGETSRTDTGCSHGTAWYAAQLGAATQAHLHGTRTLKEALAAAIDAVALLHRDSCDLSHLGTPTAGIAILRRSDSGFEWLVLGDVSLVLESDKLAIITDSHDHIAAEEQAEADQYLIGDPRKVEAMRKMKVAQLSRKNVPGGYWVAGSDPKVVEHAITGEMELASLRRALLLTDGAARLAALFELASYEELLELATGSGPQEVLARVRAAEKSDPQGARWPRNKQSDDASAVLCQFTS